MATVATTLTAQEFFAWVQLPENRGRKFDLVRGEGVEMTKPGKRPGFGCGNIARILGNFAFARKKGYVCSNDTGMIVETDPDTVRGPDIAFFEDAEHFEDLETQFARTPPLLAVEVLSPSDTLGNVMRRVKAQLRFGTRLVWLVDPEARNVTVYRPGQEPYVIEETQEITGDDVLADFHCQVGDIFTMPGD